MLIALLYQPHKHVFSRIDRWSKVYHSGLLLYTMEELDRGQKDNASDFSPLQCLLSPLSLQMLTDLLKQFLV